ncbi:GTP diphosphokinase [Ectothiorhodospiraceae bacterium 2226]|nr:GTP diphosphokinase [Ectothiorhodospiraceae bacterium 2226]
MVYVESNAPDPALPLEEGTASWLNSLAAHLDDTGTALVARALHLALRGHDGQTRASGEPYIHHALAVADILVGLRLDAEAVAAAILHDVVEDTPHTLADVEAACGAPVARLVDGLTKMRSIGAYEAPERGLSKKDRAQAESLRKLLLAMAQDVRVVLIKLADRLHNMRTLDHLPPEKRRRIARETLEIYAPLANRLGIWQIKWELEDLAFRHLEPETYRQIARFLDERRVDRERYIARVTADLDQALRAAGIEAAVKGRPKHLYSIWKKMRRKGVQLDKIFDIRAVRLLVPEVADCYAALGVVHTLWPHIPKEFDDYIATPKENRYQSIHTAVVGPEGKVLEVQIRTFEMDRQAELGVAAHWRYKEGGGRDTGFEQKVAWLRQLLDWKEEESDAGDFIDRFKSEVFQDRVYVLTPRGQVVDLPQGATPLDFAYHIHTEVGHRCRGAKVNGRMVSLNHELKSGDQVEVLTTRQGGPSRDWLNPQLGYLKTSRALSRARQWFKAQDHDKNLAEGRVALDRELRRLGAGDFALERLAKELDFPGIEELLVGVGRGDVTPAQIAGAVQRLLPPAPPSAAPTPTRRRRAMPEGDITVLGVGNLVTQFARCCRPVLGDPIVGYITRGRGVTIHRRDCRNILKMGDERRARLIEVEWGHVREGMYPVEIEIRAIDRHGLLRDVTTVLANEKTNVLAVNTSTDRADHTARITVTMEIADIDQLSRVLGRINQLPNVQEVRRRG